MRTKIKQGQSYLDKILVLTGSIDLALEVSLETGIGITDDLPIGTEIETKLVANKRIAALFAKSPDDEPATKIPEYIDDFTPVAIGFSIIGQTFRIP